MELFCLPEVQNNFFLTGETALSGFYLFHRVSNDIDLFTTDKFDFPAFLFTLKLKQPLNFSVIKESSSFASSIIEENFKFMKKNPELIPHLLRDFNRNEWTRFYDNFIQWIYNRIKPVKQADFTGIFKIKVLPLLLFTDQMSPSICLHSI